RIFLAQHLYGVHLFLLTSLAAVLSRIRPWQVGATVVLLLTCNGIGARVDEVLRLDIPNRPGARAAVAFFEEHRDPSEPVVVCSPLLYFSLLYYSENRDNWFIYDHPQYPLAHFLGGPIVTEQQLLSDAAYQAIHAPHFWIADMNSQWRHGHVPPPADRRVLCNGSFREVHDFQGTITITGYAPGAEIDR
ncbi:MAG: hypothetical protein NTW96_24460, partial [Planctomycetia bacterium]|nr:hypothetical protein [Planctomycetia bacterium]